MHVFARNRVRVAPQCPCGLKNTGFFAPFEHEEGGHCHKCNETFFEQKEKSEEKNETLPPLGPPAIKRLENELVEKSIGGLEENNLFLFFLRLGFSVEKITNVFRAYHVGTGQKKYPHATIFWLIDEKNEVRTGKIMLFDPATGKRDKAFNKWVHYEIYTKNGENFALEQCFFGQHLLLGDNKTVGIAEGQKTALFLALAAEGITWLATGGKNNLSRPSQLKCLKNKNVILFPDANCAPEWKEFAKKIMQAGAAKVSIDETLENSLTEEQKAAGFDLLDYYLLEGIAPTREEIINKNFPKEEYFISEGWKQIPDDEWAVIMAQIKEHEAFVERKTKLEKEFEELKDFFYSNEEIQKLISKKESYLLGNILIKDMEYFLTEHFNFLEENKYIDNQIRPYLNRLYYFKEQLLSGKNAFYGV